MNSRILDFLLVAVLAFGLAASKASAQVPPCFFDCINPVSPNGITLTNGGTLSTSTIQNSGAIGSFETTGPYCILVNGGTLTVDVNWNLDGVCIALAFGAKIQVNPNIAFDMVGGGIFDPSGGGALHGGVAGLSGSTVHLNGVRIDFADKAVSGDGAQSIIVEGCQIWESQRALLGTNCGSVTFTGNTCTAMGLGVATTFTPNVTVTGNSISGASNIAGLINVALATNAVINDNLINAASSAPVSGISALNVTNATINDNIINITGCKYGIWVSQAQKLTMSSNELFFTRHPTSTSGYVAIGALIQTSSDIDVKDNVINSILTGASIGFGANGSVLNNLNSKGLWVSSSSGSITDNSVSNTNIGVQFSLYCGLDEKFRGNQINGPMNVGLWIDGSTSRIGTQTCALNEWRGGFSAYGARCDGNINDSKFFVNASDYWNGGSQSPQPQFPWQFWFVPSNLAACSSSSMFQGEGGGERESQASTQNNLSDVKEVIVLPNPATNKILVSLPKMEGRYQIEVMDLAGKLILSSLTELGQTLKEIDISNVAPGLYLVNVYSGNFRYTEKLVVTR